MHAFSHSILSRFANVEKNIIRQALKPVDKRCHLKTLGLLMECKMATAGHSTNLLGRHFGIHWNRVYRYIRSSIDLRLYFSLLRLIEQSLANRLLNLAPRRTLVRPEIYSRVRNILRISIRISGIRRARVGLVKCLPRCFIRRNQRFSGRDSATPSRAIPEAMDAFVSNLKGEPNHSGARSR